MRTKVVRVRDAALWVSPSSGVDRRNDALLSDANRYRGIATRAPALPTRAPALVIVATRAPALVIGGGDRLRDSRDRDRGRDVGRGGGGSLDNDLYNSKVAGMRAANRLQSTDSNADIDFLIKRIEDVVDLKFQAHVSSIASNGSAKRIEDCDLEGLKAMGAGAGAGAVYHIGSVSIYNNSTDNSSSGGDGSNDNNSTGSNGQRPPAAAASLAGRNSLVSGKKQCRFEYARRIECQG